MGRSKGNRKPEPLPHSPRLHKLLGQVAKFYRRRFAEEPPEGHPRHSSCWTSRLPTDLDAKSLACVVA